MAAPQFGSNVAPLLPTNERYAQFKERQGQILQQHKAYSQQLEQKQSMLTQRQGDLDIAGRLFKILDSRISKPARQFLGKELAQHVGVDPKSEQFKGVSGMLTGLDPDTLQNLKAGFASSLEGASPGQIQQTVKGVLSGQVSMNDFMDQIGSAAFTTAGSSSSPGAGSGGGGDKQPQVEGQLIRAEDKSVSAGGTAGVPPSDSESDPLKKQDRLTQDQPTAGSSDGVAPAPFQPGAEGELASFEGPRTVPPQEAAASPNIVGALGLDTKQLYRNKDLIKNGYKIPYDAAGQDKIATEINTRSAGLSATFSEASKLTDLFEGHPEVLGAVGSGVRTLQSTIQQIEGLMNVINPQLKNDTLPYSSDIQKLTREVGTQLSKTHSIDTTAANAAQVDSMVLGLAYRMAIANDIPGNRLTNVILEQNLRQLGASSSPTQFKATLANTLDSTTRQFNDAMQRTVGAKGTDIIARQMSTADIKAYGDRTEKDKLANSPYLLPEDMRRSMLEEYIRRQTGEAGPVIKPGSPTLEQEQHTLGTLETQGKARAITRADQTLQLEQSREQRAGRTEERANEREDRVAAAQVRAQKQSEEQFAFSKAEHERDNAFQREQFDYRKQKDREALDLHRQEKIAAAFQHFGAAIGRGGGGGGGLSVPSLGGGQDVSAFRMAPPPQRVPPRVK